MHTGEARSEITGYEWLKTKWPTSHSSCCFKIQTGFYSGKKMIESPNFCRVIYKLRVYH